MFQARPLFSEMNFLAHFQNTVFLLISINKRLAHSSCYVVTQHLSLSLSPFFIPSFIIMYCFILLFRPCFLSPPLPPHSPPAPLQYTSPYSHHQLSLR